MVHRLVLLLGFPLGFTVISSNKDLPSSFPPLTSVAAASSTAGVFYCDDVCSSLDVHIAADGMSSITMYHYPTVYTVGLFCVVGYYR